MNQQYLCQPLFVTELISQSRQNFSNDVSYSCFYPALGRADARNEGGAAAILAEYSEKLRSVFMLRSAKPMLAMKGERFAQLPLAIPHGVGNFLRKLFFIR